MDHKNKLTMLLYGARVFVCGFILFKPTWSFPLAKSLWSCDRVSETINKHYAKLGRGISSKKLHNQTSSSDNSELLSVESSSIKSAILFSFFARGLVRVNPLTTLAQSFVYLLDSFLLSHLLSSILHSFVTLWHSGIWRPFPWINFARFSTYMPSSLLRFPCFRCYNVFITLSWP